MMTLINHLDTLKFTPRNYIVTDGDNLSSLKVIQFEKQSDFSITSIPRARSVGQSFISSIPTTSFCFMKCMLLFTTIKADLVLMNGPGTCIPITIALLLKRVIINSIHHNNLPCSLISCLILISSSEYCFGAKCRIVYVESFARVRTLSLTGKIMYRLADNFLVQWPELKALCPKVDYIGTIM